jgi:hypothetical protein
MESKEAVVFARNHADINGVMLTELEWHMFQFNHWCFWFDAADGRKWFIAVDDLDGEVQMGPV